MRSFSGSRILIGALMLVAVFMYSSNTGLWAKFSQATGIGNPNAIITLPNVPNPDSIFSDELLGELGVPNPEDVLNFPSAGKDTTGKGTTSTDGTTGTPDKDSHGEVTTSTMKDILETLPVKGKAPKTGYARDQFGQAWADTDRNGCDTRNDILARDLINPTYKNPKKPCVILTGTLNDPYTGTTINFQRGQNTSTAVQIDHVVALSNAWQTGAQKLTTQQRTQFANDPLNLWAVDGPANSAKSDKSADAWLPPNKQFRCTYVSQQILVKAKYGLWVTASEHDAMTRVLEGCK